MDVARRAWHVGRMDKKIAKLRARLDECKRNKQGRRRLIARTTRSEAAQLAVVWRRSGRSHAELGALLGVSPNMLTRWIRDEKEAVPRVRPVNVQHDGRRDVGGLVLVLASGHRVEGLAVADVIQIAAALS